MLDNSWFYFTFEHSTYGQSLGWVYSFGLRDGDWFEAALSPGVGGGVKVKVKAHRRLKAQMAAAYTGFL